MSRIKVPLICTYALWPKRISRRTKIANSKWECKSRVPICNAISRTHNSNRLEGFHQVSSKLNYLPEVSWDIFFSNGTLFFRISVESFAFKSQTQKIQWRQPRFNNGSATSWNHHGAEKVSNQNRPFSGQWFFPTSGPYPFDAINHSNLAFCGNFCS